MPEQPTDYRVAVFGSAGVGKTSLVFRFVQGTFRETYVPTIEDTYRQVISCNKQVCTLQITDTTGSHQFPAMQRLWMSKGHAFILVYSITDRASFAELATMHDELAVVKGEGELGQTPLIIVGNKTDECDDRQVSTREGESLAEKWHCGFMESSAKSNVNVKEIFQELLKMETRQHMTLAGEPRKNSRMAKLFLRSRSTKEGARKQHLSTLDYTIEPAETAKSNIASPAVSDDDLGAASRRTRNTSKSLRLKCHVVNS